MAANTTDLIRLPSALFPLPSFSVRFTPTKVGCLVGVKVGFSPTKPSLTQALALSFCRSCARHHEGDACANITYHISH
jgi:hypothetical protein